MSVLSLEEARLQLERRLAENPDPSAEECVTLGYSNGAEICLMGWRDRPVSGDVKNTPTHSNAVDSMQIMLDGGMDLYYPEDGRLIALRRGDCHVVPGGKQHACVSAVASLVLVVVGHHDRA